MAKREERLDKFFLDCNLENEFNEDYKEFLKAQENGVKILSDWLLMGTDKMGYYLIGYSNSERIEGTIVEQKGNYVIYENGEKYFVVWSSMGEALKDVIKINGYVTDGIVFPDDFEVFANQICRPRLIK